MGLSCKTVKIAHPKLENLTIEVRDKKSPITLVTPCAVIVIVSNATSFTAKVSPSMKWLDILGPCSFLSISPVPTKLESFQLDCTKDLAVMNATSQIIKASKKSLCSLYVLPGANRKVTGKKEGWAESWGELPSTILQCWDLNQNCTNFESLVVDVSRIPAPKLKLSLFPQLHFLDILVWDVEEFFSAQVVGDNRLQWLPLVRQVNA